jgi:hypothetical protein
LSTIKVNTIENRTGSSITIGGSSTSTVSITSGATLNGDGSGLTGTMGNLINTTSFSAVASQAINSVFSSTYENYKFILNITAATADANLLLKLRNGVTDKSTNYIRASFGRQSTSGGVVSSSGTTTGFNLDSVDSTATYSSYSGDILNPFNSKKTIALISMINLASDNQNYHQNIFSLQTEDYSADGLNLTASAGAITGTISIYGYSK